MQPGLESEPGLNIVRQTRILPNQKHLNLQSFSLISGIGCKLATTLRSYYCPEGLCTANALNKEPNFDKDLYQWNAQKGLQVCVKWGSLPIAIEQAVLTPPQMHKEHSCSGLGRLIWRAVRKLWCTKLCQSIVWTIATSEGMMGWTCNRAGPYHLWGGRLSLYYWLHLSND